MANINTTENPSPAAGSLTAETDTGTLETSRAGITAAGCDPPLAFAKPRPLMPLAGTPETGIAAASGGLPAEPAIPRDGKPAFRVQQRGSSYAPRVRPAKRPLSGSVSAVLSRRETAAAEAPTATAAAEAPRRRTSTPSARSASTSGPRPAGTLSGNSCRATG